MPPSYEPLLLWITVQTIVLSGLITAQNRHQPNAWVLAGFAISGVLYFAFKLGYLPQPVTRSPALLGPLLASESLAASLLALYVATTLYRLPRFAYGMLAAPPIIEALARWALIALGGREVAATQGSFWILYGQFFILLAGIGTLLVLVRHFRVYEEESADNKRMVFYLLVAPSTFIMIMNFAWFLSTSVTDAPEGHASAVVLLIATSIIVNAWLFTYIIAGPKVTHRLGLLPGSKRLRAASSLAHTADDQPLREVEDFGRAMKALQQDKLFLDPDLSLDSLARHLGLNRSRLSGAINACAETNFSNWVNIMRIDYSRHLLESTQLAVLEIAYESGFNSKSTFNRVFKTITRSTPRQWREKSRSASFRQGKESGTPS